MSDVKLLAGLRVLDFSTLLPGPCATMMLADLGAEVLRVESPDRPDFVRMLPPKQGSASAAHAYLNRGKRSIALDLKRPSAVELVKTILTAENHSIDIVVEQFRPGVMDRLGLGYEDLKAISPSLIYCSITGYGQTGPYARRAGHDINYLALAGVSSYSGHSSEGPAVSGTQIADVAGGSHQAVMHILAAVIHRQRTGEGAFLDVSMTDAALSLNHMSMAASLAGGDSPGLQTEVLNGRGAYNYYQTLDGRYMSVGALEPQFVKALCIALDSPELAGVLMSQRPADCVEARLALAAAFAQRTQAEWIRHFAPVDACVEPVLNLDEVAEHELFAAREMFMEVIDRSGGAVRQLAPPVRVRTGTDDETHRPQPAFTGASLGEDTLAVLQELGRGEADIADLVESGALGAHYRGSIKQGN